MTLRSFLGNFLHFTTRKLTSSGLRKNLGLKKSWWNEEWIAVNYDTKFLSTKRPKFLNGRTKYAVITKEKENKMSSHHPHHWYQPHPHYTSHQHLPSYTSRHLPSASPFAGSSKYEPRYTSLHPLMLTRQPSLLLSSSSAAAGSAGFLSPPPPQVDYLEPFPHAMTEWRDR